MPVRIGELLLKEKRITPAQLQEALNYQKTSGGKLGVQPRQARLRQGRGDHRAALEAVRRPLDQPRAVRDRSGHHQADSRRDRAQVPDRSAQPSRRDADDRDDGSDQRVRHGRHQVHDGLQRRAGRRVRDRGGGRHRSAITPRAAAPRSDAKTKRRAARAGRRPEQRRDPRDGHPGARGDRGDRRRRRRDARGDRADRRRVAREAGRRGAGHPAREPDADVGDPEGRERHPHRAVREGIPRPVPHRRHPLQRHGAADEVPRRDHVAHQDHGEARHRGEAAAAGRPHQDPLRRRRRRHQGDRLPRLRACRRCSAKRSSCACSTRTSSCST